PPLSRLRRSLTVVPLGKRRDGPFRYWRPPEQAVCCGYCVYVFPEGRRHEPFPRAGARRLRPACVGEGAAADAIPGRRVSQRCARWYRALAGGATIAEYHLGAQPAHAARRSVGSAAFTLPPATEVAGNVPLT